MKRLIAGWLMLLVLLGCGGCKKADTMPLPEFFYYEVAYNGRTYDTNGCPYRYEAADEKSGFLAAKSASLGTSANLDGTFPAGTTFYSMTGISEKIQILAILEDELHYFLLSSYDTVAVSSGKSILSAVGLDNNCAALYQYNKKKTKMLKLPMTVKELDTFGTAYSAGTLTTPSGKSAELVSKAFTGEIARFTLYENGAIVYEACPQYAVDLGSEMSTLLWSYINA